MNDIRVNYAESLHGEDEIDAVVRVLRSSTQMGFHVREFEAIVARHLGKKFGVMVNSGSSALMLARDLLRLREGSEIITPALTFSTTVAPLVRAGLIPAFVDVEEGTYNIDAEQVEAMVTSQTAAIFVPNLIGNLPNWDRLCEIAKRHGMRVVEDSCDTLGALLKGQSTGTRSDISVTSFYGSHLINCAGNGGLLATDDPEIAIRARLLRSWGRSSSQFNPQDSESIERRFNVTLDGIPYDRKFLFEEIGYNLEPSELGAAFGLVQLKKLKTFIEMRRRRFVEHFDFFKKYEEFFILPREIENARTGWLAFPLTVRDNALFRRCDIQIYLEKNNIQTRPIFTGNIMRQPGFFAVKRKESPDGYPNTDQVMRGGILIACHQGLANQHMAHMRSVVESFFKDIR